MLNSLALTSFSLGLDRVHISGSLSSSSAWIVFTSAALSLHLRLGLCSHQRRFLLSSAWIAFTSAALSLYRRLGSCSSSVSLYHYREIKKQLATEMHLPIIYLYFSKFLYTRYTISYKLFFLIIFFNIKYQANKFHILNLFNINIHVYTKIK